MGRLVESLAPELDCHVVGVLDEAENAAGAGLTDAMARTADVAVDFTTPDAVRQNIGRYTALKLNAVIGTTGWTSDRAALREEAERAGIGIVAAANFSIGAVLFEAIAADAARRLAARPEFGAFLHETHHDKKIDAPSGTALSIKSMMESAGYSRKIDVASSRVGFDGPSETIMLTHSVRDRGTFARGALLAATWVKGRRGWFTMRDVLGLSTDE